MPPNTDVVRGHRVVAFGGARASTAVASVRPTGLGDRKHSFAVGYDAGPFDPEARFVVDPDRLFHRYPLTPCARRELAGVVHRTWRRPPAGLRPARAPGTSRRR